MVESKFKPCPGLNEGAANVGAWKLVCTINARETIRSQTARSQTACSQTAFQKTISEGIFTEVYEVRRYPLSLHIFARARLE